MGCAGYWCNVACKLQNLALHKWTKQFSQNPKLYFVAMPRQRFDHLWSAANSQCTKSILFMQPAHCLAQSDLILGARYGEFCISSLHFTSFNGDSHQVQEISPAWSDYPLYYAKIHFPNTHRPKERLLALFNVAFEWSKRFCKNLVL
jgi:hypothetical protein